MMRLTVLSIFMMSLSGIAQAVPIEQVSLSQPSNSGSVRYIDSSGRANTPVAVAPPSSTSTITQDRVADIQQQISDLSQKLEQQNGQIDDLQQQIQGLKQRLASTQAAATPKKSSSTVKQAQRAAAPAISKSTTSVQSASKSVAPSRPSSKANQSTTTRSTAKPTNTTTQPTLSDRAAYNKAYDAYQQGGAAKAIAPMQNFIKQYPSSPYVSYAYYWLGEFSLAITPAKYLTAKQHFQHVVKHYPQSSKAPGALYRLIEIAQNVDKKPTLAQQYYQQLAKNYPKSKELQQAKKDLKIK